MALNRNSWRAKQRQPKEVAVAALGGEMARVRPISAKRRGDINKRFPDDGDGKPLDPIAFSAAFIAYMIVDEAGEPVFTEEELTGDDFDDAIFQELAKITGGFLGVGPDAKN